MSVRTISTAGVQWIASWEGLSLKVYNDAGGHATIGYGHLLHFGRYTIKDRQTITKEEATALLRRDVQKYVDAVNSVVTQPLTQNQFDACVSLCFNIGTGAFRSSSVAKAINLGRADETYTMRALFCLWQNVGGKPNAGLLQRRLAEAQLFNTPDPR